MSNRLPVALSQTQTGPRLVSSPGGLVTALGPVLGERGGHWIGWLGAAAPLPPNHDPKAEPRDDPGDRLAALERTLGYRLHPVELTAEELAGHYHGFSNEVLWPLFHDFISHCNFDPGYWPVYREVNEKFAHEVATASEPDDYVWIHDYQLAPVASELSRLGVRREVGSLFRHPDDTELLAYYRVCEVALITPLKDGMNLVSKEYCACSLEGNGVLILSEFAGAATQLREGALIVNPFDIVEMADAIHQAVTMPEPERRQRMQRLRSSVREHDVHAWVEGYLAAAASARRA